jgi:methylglyoxal synthase
MKKKKSSETLTIGMIAHDNKKRDLLEWAEYNKERLSGHTIVATGTTGTLLEKLLDVPVIKMRSGPLGGDQEIGAMLANGKIDVLIFFWDGLDAHPHDPDVKALLRLSVVWNIPTACNRATADMIVASPLFTTDYERYLPDHTEYSRSRKLEVDPDEDPAAILASVKRENMTDESEEVK